MYFKADYLTTIFMAFYENTIIAKQDLPATELKNSR